jgi:hypothetical protein
MVVVVVVVVVAVSKMELTKYLWSLLRTARPVVSGRTNDEVRQLVWWRRTEGTNAGRDTTYTDASRSGLIDLVSIGHELVRSSLLAHNLRKRYQH